MIYFEGMGSIFATVVTLIFAAETFAGGLKAVGFIDMLLGITNGQGVTSMLLMLMLVSIIGVIAILTGSGNAAFFSFGNLAPGFAAGANIATAALVLPMQLVSGLFRTMSPVAGVIIAVSGTAEIDPFTIVKRTVIPMAGGILAVVAYAMIIF
jgi:DcuC family C4-dicarboxylate transporter